MDRRYRDRTQGREPGGIRYLLSMGGLCEAVLEAISKIHFIRQSTLVNSVFKSQNAWSLGAVCIIEVGCSIKVIILWPETQNDSIIERGDIA